jgi:hypothetical protein
VVSVERPPAEYGSTLINPGHDSLLGRLRPLLKLDLDIPCPEKVFDGGAHKVLSKALNARYPYQYGPANSKLSIKVNSGVWVVSRFPLTELKEIQFRDCTASSVNSRKGAMLLTGSFQGHVFQILATHSQGEEGASYIGATPASPLAIP